MKTKLLEMGGKLWEKENITRVYIKDNVIKKLVKQNTFSDFEEKSMKKAVTYYDGKFHSDNGTVRVILNRNGYECEK